MGIYRNAWVVREGHEHEEHDQRVSRYRLRIEVKLGFLSGLLPLPPFSLQSH